MPEAAKRALKAEARKKGFTGERFRKYVYGGLRNLDWKPSHQKNKDSKAKRGLRRIASGKKR